MSPEELANLYRDGMSLHQISRVMGVSHETVRRRLIDQGVPLRTSHEGLRLRLERQQRQG